MASSSSYSQPTPATSSQSCNCDVFLSFRGEDTRKTFVDHLYAALVDRNICTYKDDEALVRGESIRQSLFKAIKGSQIAVIIFSKRYADSSWCLEELAYIMKCKDQRGLIVMPIFYDVVPSEVRKQEGDFGRGFAKQEVRNFNKVESWRKALVDACEIAGWEPKNIANGHESKVIKEIVDTVSDKLFSMDSCVDEDLVGMSTRLQELEAQTDVGSHDVRMVGVWGIGGSGKTTLASSLYMKMNRHFQGHCIIDNIREESSKHGVKTLQGNFLSRLLKTKMELQSVEEGKHMISRLKHSKVLVLLDDVDDCKQLEALVGSHNWFGSGSRIIITTRDEHLLIAHKVDHVYPVTLLSHEEGLKLFNKHAYNKDNLVNDYEMLSSHVVSYAAGLPLALKVLGSFLYDKNKKEWLSSLSRLKDIPETEIVEKLKISYDGLKTVEKQLFLDIACFFGGKSTKNTYYGMDDAMEVFEACGYHPDIGIKVLRQKALITIVDGKFDMHDLVQEMGHYIVRGKHPNNPEKHSRVWKDEEIVIMCHGDATMENDKTEAIQHLHPFPPYGHLSLVCKSVSNMKKLRWLSLILYNKCNENVEGPTFLSDELQYIRWCSYSRNPFPDSFQPMKLVVLKLSQSLQKQLWKGYKHLPRLKVLELKYMKNLLSTPNFDGIPCLQKLTLYHCEDLQEIHPSLGKHASLEHISVSYCCKLRKSPTIVHMGKLETLEITHCHKSLGFPEIKSNMKSLVKLYLGNMGIDVLLASIGDRCPNLISLYLVNCFYLQNKELNFYGLTHLEEFSLNGSNCLKMLDHICSSWLISKAVCRRSRLPNFWLWLLFPQLTHNLQKLDLGCCHLKDGEIPCDIGKLSNLEELNLKHNDFTRLDFSLLQLTRLKILIVTYCKRLVELPKLPQGMVILVADYCKSLATVGNFYTSCKWLCHVSLVRGGDVIDGSRLLQSMLTMLEVNAIKKHSMILKLEGLEVAKGFRPPLLRGSRCRLKLPENWFNDFSGFLMCAVGAYDHSYYAEMISMEQVNSGMDSEDDVIWEESDSDQRTLVWYVPFASLSHIAWWDSTHKEILFSLGLGDAYRSFSGFGVRLVAMKTGSGPLETEISNYVPNFSIVQDSQYALKIMFTYKYEIGAEWGYAL
ncbi:disease resistance protein Roq1-like isoform X1 [Bidens hawaiensis]|uniref:disease resistance protein Roq1-like isoform X1 n=2 Tax=Bidens hawaiensis TaxID=980011 RepID=UPI00404B6AD6